MKILFIHTYYQQNGGEDQVFESEVKAMEAAGFKVETLVFSNSKHAILKWMLLPFNPFSFVRTIKKINSFAPDVAHIHNLHFAASPSVLFALNRKKIPVVVTIHNFRLLIPSGHLFFTDEPYINSHYKGFPWAMVRKGVYKNSKILTFWLALNTRVHKSTGIWNTVKKFIFLNEYASTIFMNYYNDLRHRFIVKPNFLPDPGVSLSNREDYFLFVGRLSAEKGIEVLLNAHSKGKFNLTILGDGPLSNMVKEHSENYRNCVHLGYKSKDVVLNHLKRCSAIILPSTCLEMNPFSVIESFACGTPIIASDLGTLKPYVVDKSNSILFRPNDPESLAAAIVKFRQLTIDELELVSQNSRKTYMRFFTETQHLDIMTKVYSSALD